MSEHWDIPMEDLIRAVRRTADGIGSAAIMEVCGTHTANIRKYGIDSLLPGNIRLVSGPGCPVCVTSGEDIAAALDLADRKDVLFACFGDMLRVPCGGESLYTLYERGRKVHLVTSPLDVLELARHNEEEQVVYFGIGFETTAPLTAALVEAAEAERIHNLSVLCAHRTMPRAIEQLLGTSRPIDALLCPGHVATIIGADAFSFVPNKLHRPAAVAGFEAPDILAAILRILEMLRDGEVSCVNMYPRAVTRGGNPRALELLYKAMEPSDTVWRGLGSVPGSGLRLLPRYAELDARRRFRITRAAPPEPAGCLCAAILRGERTPRECAHFGMDCTPDRPVGPCMVSSEGSCAAYYRYRER